MTASLIVSTLLMMIAYLIILRFVDMNEKEPLWAMAMLFGLGAMLSVIVPRLVPPEMLELSFFREAVTKEMALFLAIGAGVLALAVYGQIRGWDEFNGTMDGIVYGATAGLGFATAREVTSALTFGTAGLPGMEMSLYSGFSKAVLSGLSYGVFGAIAGAGIGAASEARSPILRALLPMMGLLGAIVAHLGYLTFAHGNALGGMQGFIRMQLALAMPIVLVIALAFYALAKERRSIREQLADEAASGVVSSEELALLRSVPKREAVYLRHLLTLKLGVWKKTKALHNLQAQLAFTKQRAAGEKDPARRARYEADAAKIRSAVLEKKQAMGVALRIQEGP